jgi:hypothetical protein
MIYENKEKTIPYILSEAAQDAYAKIKALILRIFSLLKKQEKEKDLKEQFYDSYIDFARKLDQEGYKNESTSYMAICAMYYRLMDRPDELMAHESFFMDLFNAFDEILFVRINNPEEYEEKYEEFLKFRGKMQDYYYTEVAIPSPNYDKDVCKEIISHLARD